jgi:hypothetical protein
MGLDYQYKLNPPVDGMILHILKTKTPPLIMLLSSYESTTPDFGNLQNFLAICSLLCASFSPII